MTRVADERTLLDEQIAYYRARAGEYDEWWFRTGRFDRGADINAAWRAEVACRRVRGCRNAVERAAGDGARARVRHRPLHAAPGAARRGCHGGRRVTGGDRDQSRPGCARRTFDYVQADLFACEPDTRYDCVFMSFWLSHVPDARFDAFWAMVRRALAPGGFAYVVDSAHDPTSTAANIRRPTAMPGS